MVILANSSSNAYNFVAMKPALKVEDQNIIKINMNAACRDGWELPVAYWSHPSPRKSAGRHWLYEWMMPATRSLAAAPANN
jgi:hypothetical protein